MKRKYNRKFNAYRKRLERWHVIVSHLSGFEGVVNDYDGETPEGVRILKAIHRKLYECSEMAKGQLKEMRKTAERTFQHGRKESDND